MYAKANTKSKKKRMAFDLIFFEDMYNSLADDDMIFPWTYDKELMEVRNDFAIGLVKNILDNQNFLIEVAENSFDIFLENDFSIYCDYGKNFHRLSEEMLQKYIVQFYKSIDSSLKERFRNKFDNSEIFVNNRIKFYAGVFFPIEAVEKVLYFSELVMI